MKKNNLLYTLLEHGWKFIGDKQLDYPSEFKCDNCHFVNLINIVYIKDLQEEKIYRLGEDCYAELKNLTYSEKFKDRKHKTFEERKEYAEKLIEEWDKNWWRK